jgi:hypothetical protein
MRDAHLETVREAEQDQELATYVAEKEKPLVVLDR